VASNAHGTTTPTSHPHAALPSEAVLVAPAPPPAVPLRPPAGAWGLVLVAVRTTDVAGAPVRLTGDALTFDTADLLAGVWRCPHTARRPAHRGRRGTPPCARR
jgi:hypothetical protein